MGDAVCKFYYTLPTPWEEEDRKWDFHLS